MKAGLSDPADSMWKGRRSSDKRYSGDNRLISPKSSYRRGGLAPRCRLILMAPSVVSAIHKVMSVLVGEGENHLLWRYVDQLSLMVNQSRVSGTAG